MMKYRDVVDFRLRGIAVAAMFDFLQFEKLAVCRLSGGGAICVTMQNVIKIRRTVTHT